MGRREKSRNRMKKPRVIIKHIKNLSYKNRISLRELLLDCWDYEHDLDNGSWFLAYFEGEMVAAGQLIKGVLWNLCSKKSFRGKGIGRKLIQKILNYICKNMKKLNLTELFLFVDPTSPVNWYRRMGFEFVSKSAIDGKLLWRPDVSKLKKKACSRLKKRSRRR